MPASKSTSTEQLVFLFQFYTIIDQNQNFDFGSIQIHLLASTNREVMGNWQNFTVFHSPLNLSIILFLELKHLAKFCWRHHQFHYIGHFNQYHIVCTLPFTGNYIDSNAQTNTRP